MENNIIVSVILSVIASSGFWSFLMFFISQKKENVSIEKKTLQALTRNELLKEYKKFKKEGLDIDDKANFENLYNCYHNLGKNGVMDNIYSEVMSMEIKN